MGVPEISDQINTHLVVLTRNGAIPRQKQTPIRYGLVEVRAVLPKDVVSQTAVETSEGSNGVGCEPKG